MSWFDLCKGKLILALAPRDEVQLSFSFICFTSENHRAWFEGKAFSLAVIFMLFRLGLGSQIRGGRCDAACLSYTNESEDGALRENPYWVACYLVWAKW
jgi:hypothetical protein